MNGLPLFNIPETPPKQVADTSREAYQDIKVNIGQRQLTVLKALNYRQQKLPGYPTAYELLTFMQGWRPELDLNSVRPRLTELKEQGLVETPCKLRCSMTGKKALTWRVSERGTLFLRSRG